MTNNIYDIVLFHYPCQDGLSSAWIVNKFHQDKNIDIDLYPIQYGKTINLDRLTNKKIIFCDFSPPEDVLNEIEKVALKITILDHHISAQKALVNKDYAIFDMNKSGAGLTWDYFYPTRKMPLFIKMVQDRDLWKWEIKNSKEFTTGFYTACSGIGMYDFSDLFELFNELDTNATKINFYIELGEIINKSIFMKCKYLTLESLKKINHYQNYNVCIVNCSNDISSDLGNMLSSSEGCDFAALWSYNHTKEEYYVSLRSSNKADVSLIAKEFGGGGHKNAAGFSTKINPIILFN
jgi:oligoribonuclease NrnB/cAMP/cGMP phosphodiesterase (DHH superfamily)